MKKIHISVIAFATFFAASCGTETTNDTAEATPAADSTATECTYTFVDSTTKLTWTAFKTTEKIAVAGSFDTYMVENTISASSEAAVFENATFQIVTSTVNTGNPERDPKILKFFFNTLVSSDTISGGVRSISATENGQGTAIIYVKMNEVERDVNATYTIDGTVLTLSADIDVNEWNAASGIEALNTECYELHKGTDGESKLWSEVHLEISTDLEKECL
jgi:polyisoprenoid-binding protein YceI